MKTATLYIAGVRATLRGSLLLMMSVTAHAQPNAPQVIVADAEEMLLAEEVSVSGSVFSPKVAKLSAQVSGIVDVIHVDIGDKLPAGAEVLRLNDELNKLSLVAARAATSQAREELSDAKRRLSDIEALAQKKTASANEMQSLAAEVRIDTAALERFSAEESRQQELLRRHVLNAPFAGVVSSKLVEVGEWIQPGDPVIELVATENLHIDLQVPQTVYGKLGQSNEVRIKFDAFPGRIFDGQIASVVPVTDLASRTFTLRVRLVDSQIKLAPGMSASAVLRLHTEKTGIVVPRDALLRYPDGRISVWVVTRDGDAATVSEQRVETGLSFSGKMTITRGLSAGAVVVVKGNESLRDGQSVNIKPAVD